MVWTLGQQSPPSYHGEDVIEPPNGSSVLPTLKSASAFPLTKSNGSHINVLRVGLICRILAKINNTLTIIIDYIPSWLQTKFLKRTLQPKDLFPSFISSYIVRFNLRHFCEDLQFRLAGNSSSCTSEQIPRS